MFSKVLYRAYLLLMRKFAKSDCILSIQMMERPSLGYLEIPWCAESLSDSCYACRNSLVDGHNHPRKEFGYIDEDGQAHVTRRIDWDYLLG